MLERIFRRLRSLLALPVSLPVHFRKLEQAVLRAGTQASVATEKSQRVIEHRLAGLDRDTAALREGVAALRQETHDRLLQYHMQLGRLSALLDGRTDASDYKTLGGRFPVHLETGVPEPSIALEPAAPDDWLTLARCPACDTAERTIVCEWNTLAILDTAPDTRSSVYNYAICHGCGLLFATERPTGRRYGYLMEHFEDVIHKDSSSPLLNPYPLSEDDRVRYRRLIARGVFVSSHEGGESLEGVFKDRLANAAHLEVLGSLLDLRGARVLEVRSRAGTILAGLKRLYGAEVYAMPIFESQQLILRELYNIPTGDLIDFENFSIPFEGTFDLIVCNHMVTHAVRLDRFLETVRASLRPGGHLYLYNEIDDSDFLDHVKSMIVTMNPLHLQAADRRSLIRALGARGFAPVFVKGHQRRPLYLAQRVEQPQWTPIDAVERERRIARYQQARDRAVLRTPAAVRNRFANVWTATVERAVASGVAVFDDTGAVKIVKE